MRSRLNDLSCLLLATSIILTQIGRVKATVPAEGIDLLADTSLKGWTRVPVPPAAPLTPISPWKADPASGRLICEGEKSGHEWLRYDKEFGNFLFHVEWRFIKLEGDPKYNSGIYFRNSLDGAIWHQAQLGSASGGYIFGNTLVNGAPRRVNLSSQLMGKRVKPAGEWNTFDIRAEGRNLVVSVDGVVTSKYADCEVERGYVGLEAEGYRIEFRNMKLKELP